MATGLYRERNKWEASVPGDLRSDEAFAFTRPLPDLPNVLLIGDSISIGYTSEVRRRLTGIANVARVPENARTTRSSLAQIDRWLDDESWDIIHFNWGLHDLVRVRTSDQELAHQVPRQEYAENLRRLVERLRISASRLVWASTTPVPIGAQERFLQDEVSYNLIAAGVMARSTIPTNDLWTFVRQSTLDLQLPSDVHFTEQGYRALGVNVAGSLAAALYS